MKHFTLRFRSLVCLVFVAFLAVRCGSGTAREQIEGTAVRIKGSDTMLLLASRWAEEFMKSHPGISVYVEGGGTERGIAALIEGDVNLCTASRTLLPSEVRSLLNKRGSLGLSILTAKDALSVYLHPDNKVRNLKLDQVRDLFTGVIRNWKEFGGEDLPVTVISRPPNSGTYLFFEEHVLMGVPYTTQAVTVPSTDAVIASVVEQLGGIGYGGLAYGDQLLHASIDGIEATKDNVRNGSYPISRYLYLFAASQLEGANKRFVDWVLSDAGQAVVEEVGFIPLWDATEFEMKISD